MHPILICMGFGTLFGAGLAIATEQAPLSAPAHTASTPVLKYQDRLRAADENGDGMLSKPEAQRARMHRIVESFDRLDMDRNGLLAPAEIRLLLKSRISS